MTFTLIIIIFIYIFAHFVIWQLRKMFPSHRWVTILNRVTIILDLALGIFLALSSCFAFIMYIFALAVFWQLWKTFGGDKPV
jgi:hypothetical protein